MLRLLLFVLFIIAVVPLARGQYTGDVNDGASTGYACTITLNGANSFSISAINGSPDFCDFATEQYSVTLTGASQNTTIVWSVPPGATVTSGQGTSSILVTFGNTSGNVRVDVSSPCTSLFSIHAVSSAICTFFNGGNNDGFTLSEDCASNLNGGSVFIPGPIVGSTTFCEFATEAYAINVAGTSPETTYTWSVPAGATITSGQGTNSILVTFGNTSGNVSVDVANSCELINVALPVSVTSCTFYAGGDNDGFTTTTDCASSLNGGSVFTPGPIVGSTTFCDFATETYTISVAGTTAETTYTWSVPPGATITSGQGTNSILVTFGNAGGNISIDVANPCELINVQLAVSTTACIFYAGGNNDGFSNTTDCASSLNGGSTFVPGPIVGSVSFCDFATESYTITVAGATAETTYLWSVPLGAVVTSGQGTNSILVTFGNTGGNISVDVANPCELINVQLAVSTTACIFYAGGNNDGFSKAQTCISSLNGTSAFTPGPIVGSTAFCNFATESYAITVAGANATTVYSWTVPPGATVTSGQGTSTILVTFGSTAGNVSVNVSNDCETVPVSLAVSPTSCIFYAGGVSDGFAFTLAFNTPLPIELISFEANVVRSIVNLKWVTASELNNDFFTIERSEDGEKFKAIQTIRGSGTTAARTSYETEDRTPLPGRSYYRLTQTDYDGSVSYSNVVLVDVEQSTNKVVSLYPNPINNSQVLTIVYSAIGAGNIEIAITEISGKPVQRKSIPVVAGDNTILLSTEFNSSGVYLLEVNGLGGREVFRLIVN